MFGRNQAHAQDAAVQLLIRATTCAACNFQFILPFEICDEQLEKQKKTTLFASNY
jgi:hypothetical protein